MLPTRQRRFDATDHTTARDPRPDSVRQAHSHNDSWETEVFVLRGADRDDLRRRIAPLRGALAERPQVPLKDLAATINLSLLPGGSRLAIVAGTAKDLDERLARAAERLADSRCTRLRDALGVYFVDRPLYGPGRLAYLFPGEGAQYLGMLGDLCRHFPDVRTCLARCDHLAASAEGSDRAVSRFVEVDATVSSERRAELQRDLRQLDHAMFSVLAADWAIGDLLQRLGVEADAVAGHSAGELAALWCAGCLDATSQLEHVVAAIRSLREDEERAGAAAAILLAVGASRGEMVELIRAIVPSDAGEQAHPLAYVAMDNCPHQTVLVGIPDVMARIEAELSARKVMHARLPLARPYHTPLFEPMMGSLAAMFDGAKFFPPRKTLYSCTTARPFPADPDEIRRLAIAHWAAPVEFTQLIRNMHADGIRLFVEAGPRGNLSAFVEDILRGEEFLAVPANVPRRSSITQLNHLVAQLAVHQVPLEFDYLYKHRDPRQVDWNDVAERKARRVARPTTKDAPANDVPSVGSSAPSTVLLRYWDVMEQFVVDQQRVMQRYLSRRKGASMGRRKAPITLRNSPDRERGGMRTPRLQAGAAPVCGGPLSGTIVRHEPMREMVMRRRLDLREDLYADDHTVGGRDISRVDPQQHGLPVMPMTFILEMMAEVASALVPGKVVTSVRQVQLRRWLAFEDTAGTVETLARVVSTSAKETLVEVEVRDLGAESSRGESTGATTAAGTIVLCDRYPTPPALEATRFTHERPCRVSIATLYRNLFHGPLFQGVTALDRVGDEGLVAEIEVQPRKGMFRATDAPQFLIDPVTVDIAMHPAAGWHLEQPDQAGRILLPFEVQQIDFFGPSPVVGTRFAATNRITHASRRQFAHSGELVDSSGRMWCRLTGVKCWRFYLPFGEVNFNGPKDEYFISKIWVPGWSNESQGRNALEGAVCVRLDPGEDLAQSGMQEAGARVTLSPREMQEFLSFTGGTSQRTRWLFSRIAAKDAVRILWHQQHGERLFIADVEMDVDQYGRQRACARGASRPADYPNVAVACDGNLYVALASGRPFVGLALRSLESIEPREAEVDGDEGAVRILEAAKPERREALARLAAAKEALAGALGPALLADRLRLVARDADASMRCIGLGIPPELAGVFPELQGREIAVWTAREGDYVVAATFCEPRERAT